MIIHKLAQFFRLNLIALKINNTYKYNIYMLIVLFISIIASVILRSHIYYLPNPLGKGWIEFVTFNYFNLIMSLIFIFSIFYSIKLIVDIIIRCIQAYKIIPEFISLYKQSSTFGSAAAMINVQSIISLYYLQNSFFISLSLWILYIMLTKLNLFIDGIYLFIITLGILSTIIFIYCYSLPGFNINQNLKEYSLKCYLFFIFILIFYMFAFPLCVINIINSDKFINFFKDYDLLDFNDYIKRTYSYMNNPNSPSSTEQENVSIPSTTIRNNNSYNPIIVATDSGENLDISDNNANNGIRVVPRSNPTMNPQSHTTQITQVHIHQSLGSNTPHIDSTTISRTNTTQGRALITRPYLGDFRNRVINKTVPHFDGNNPMLHIAQSKFSFSSTDSIAEVGLHKNGLQSRLAKIFGVKMFKHNIGFKSTPNLPKLLHLGGVTIFKVPRISLSFYETLISNVNDLTYYIKHINNISNVEYLQIILLSELDIINNILHFNRDLQYVLLHKLNTKDLEDFKMLISKYSLPSVAINKAQISSSTVIADIKFNIEIQKLLSEKILSEEINLNFTHCESLVKHLNTDNLREYYIFNDFDYLNSDYKINSPNPKIVYSKLIYNLFLCYNDLKLIKGNNNLFNKQILDNLCDIYIKNYLTLTSKFSTTKFNQYDKVEMVSFNNFKKSRESYFFAELINKYSINSKYKS